MRCGGRPAGWSRATGESGFAAGAEALVFGLLVFVVGTLVVLNAWSVVDAKFATSAAAREAVRAVVEADLGADLDIEARGAADAAFAGHGRDPAGLVVAWDGDGPGPLQERCAEVRYRVAATVAVVGVPGFVPRRRFEVSSVYSELIDPFRTGLAGSRCDA